MPIRVVAHVPDSAAHVRLVDDAHHLLIGRDAACDLHLSHPSISRRHAILHRRDQQWVVDDQASKNGMRVNGKPVASVTVNQPRWLQLGDIYLECEPLTTAVARQLQQRTRQRRHDSQVLESRLQADRGLEQLVQQGLRDLLSLADCDRGFVLLGDGDELRVHACEGLQMEELGDSRFGGSVGAVQRALDDGRSVVCHDTASLAWLRERESVVSGGIQALLSLPLRADGHTIGAVYLDSRSPGHCFTDLDLELIEAFAARLATVLDAVRMREAIADMQAQLGAATGSRHCAWTGITSRHGLCRED